MKAKTNVTRAFCILLIAVMLLSIMPFGLFDTVAKAQTDVKQQPEAKSATRSYGDRDELSKAANRYGQYLQFKGDFKALSNVPRSYGTGYAAKADALCGEEQYMTTTVVITKTSYVHFDYLFNAAYDKCAFSFGYTKNAGEFEEVLFVWDAAILWNHYSLCLEPGTYELRWGFSTDGYCETPLDHYILVDDVYVGTSNINLGIYPAGNTVGQMDIFSFAGTPLYSNLVSGYMPQGATISSSTSGASGSFFLKAFTPYAPGTYEFSVEFKTSITTSTVTYLITVVDSTTHKATALPRGCIDVLMTETVYDKKDLVSYDIIIGEMPEGLTLNIDRKGNGIISGRPQKTGEYAFIIQFNGAYTESFTITVDEADRTVVLNNATINMPYSAFIYKLTDGNKASDLCIYGNIGSFNITESYDTSNTATYTLNGTPTELGYYTFAVAYTLKGSQTLKDIIIYKIGVSEPKIDSIVIDNTFITPIIGRKVKYSIYNSCPDGAHYTIQDNAWYNETDGGYMNDDDVFEVGKEYSVTLMVSAESGYVFSEDAAISVNGITFTEENAILSLEDSDSSYYITTNPTKAVNAAPIDNITITDADVTAYVGKTAGDYLDYTLPDDANYVVKYHRWFCDTHNTDVSKTDKFNSSYDYSMGWDLIPKDGYAFTSATKVTLNGNTDLLDSDYTLVQYNGAGYKVWTVSAKPTETIAIDNIVLTNADVNAVVGIEAGKALEYTIPEHAAYTVTNHYWFCDDDNLIMNSDDVFEEGKAYSLAWVFEAKEGYKFTSSTQVTINGETALVDTGMTGLVSSSTDSLYKVWTNPYKSVSKIKIYKVEINDVVTMPVVGKTAGETLGYSFPEGAPYITITHNWYNITDDVTMEPSDVFEAGKKYNLGWYITAKSGYEFASVATVTINGETDMISAENTSITNFCTAYRIWTVEVVPTGVVDRIEINDVKTKPNVGDTVNDYLTYTLGAGSKFSVNDLSWFCDTDDVFMRENDVFEENKFYSLKWVLEAKGSYIFTDYTLIFINGDTALVDTVNSGIDHDDDSDKIYCVWSVSVEAQKPAELIEIDNISIKNAEITPVAGEKAGDTLAYTLPDDAPYTVKEHSWYCSTDDKMMDDNDVFEAGKKYTLGWTLTANDGYKFTDTTEVLINNNTELADKAFTGVSDSGSTFEVWTKPVEIAEESKYELGDVNLDGKVNTGDAVLILRQVAGTASFTEEQASLADFNGDGKVNTGDAVAILKFCVGIKSEKLNITK